MALQPYELQLFSNFGNENSGGSLNIQKTIGDELIIAVCIFVIFFN